jgi:hypothetical protein
LDFLDWFFLDLCVGELSSGGRLGEGLKVEGTFPGELFESDIGISFGGGVGGAGSKSGAMSETLGFVVCEAVL